MKPRQIVPNVHLIGAVDWDRRLFDALIPLPDGTSYNAYFVQGSEKNALLDTVDPAKCADASWLSSTSCRRPTTWSIQHVEQDHSGCAPMLLERFPELTIVCNEKAKSMLIDHLHVDDARFQVVADGDTLSLGDKTLTFVFTPWVHWPETMSTWLEEDRILFSCDFFGSHYATSDVFADRHEVYDGAKRYYAEIMMPFGAQVTKNIEKVTKYPIRIHRPEPRSRLRRPRLHHRGLPGLGGRRPAEHRVPAVRLACTTARGSWSTTSRPRSPTAASPWSASTSPRSMPASSRARSSTPARSCSARRRSSTGPHPLAAYAAFLANALRPQAKFATVIGSYGWAGKTVETLVGMMPKLKVEFLDPVLAKGMPREADYAALDALADTIVAKHEGLAPRNFADLVVCRTEPGRRPPRRSDAVSAAAPDVGVAQPPQALAAEGLVVPGVHDLDGQLAQPFHGAHVRGDVRLRQRVDEPAVVDRVAAEQRASASSNSPMLPGVCPGRCTTSSRRSPRSMRSPPSTKRVAATGAMRKATGSKASSLVPC